MLNRILFLTALLLLTGSAIAMPNFMQSTQQTPTVIKILPGPANAAPELFAPEPSAAKPSSSDYLLGSGDKLRITIFGEEELSGEFDIDGAGSLSLPLIGQVNAHNVTVPALEKKLTAKYRDGYLIAPRISVEVMNFRPFFIVGEISNPGHYPYISGLTVLNAVAVAGGYTPRAKKSKIQLKRAVNGKEEIQIVTEAALVQPGDVIEVQERFF